MRVLGACSIGGAGHWNPLLPVLAAARRGGHEVVVVAPESMGAQVRAAGFEFRGGGQPAERDVAAIRDRLPLVPQAEAIVLGNCELFGRLAAPALLPAMQRAATDWRPDVVVRETCEFASAAVADRLGVPAIQVAVSSAAGELASIAAAEPALRELRGGLVERLLASPYLTRFPASLDPSPFPDTVRFREPGRRPEPLPDRWPDAGRPLVYVTLGSVFGRLAGAVTSYRAVLGAVAELPVRVLLTVGHGVEVSALGPQPANVRVRTWVEQVDALAAADLVVCHGGSGTVFGALAAGLPTVVVPAFADQGSNGRRVAQVGAGLVVETDPVGAAGTRRLPDERDAPRIAAAVRRVLGDPGFRVAAERIGAEMAAAPLVDDAVTGLLVGPVGPD